MQTQNETVSKFRVVGILKEKGMSMDLNSDNAIIMTEKSFVGQFGGDEEYDQVNVILNNIDDANKTKTRDRRTSSTVRPTSSPSRTAAG